MFSYLGLNLWDFPECDTPASIHPWLAWRKIAPYPWAERAANSSYQPGPARAHKTRAPRGGKYFIPGAGWCHYHTPFRDISSPVFLMLPQLEWFHTRRQSQEDQEGPGGWLFLHLWYGGVWPLDYWSRRCDWRCGEYFSWSGCPSLPSSSLPARQVWDVNMRPGATGLTWPAE